MNPPSDTLSLGDVITDAAGFLAALGAGTMILFPLAIPGLALIVVPLMLLAAAVGLLVAVAAVPVLTLVALRRVARPSTTDHKVRA